MDSMSINYADLEAPTVITHAAVCTSTDSGTADSAVATVHAVDVFTEHAASLRSQVATALRLRERKHRNSVRAVATYRGD